jgi:hypothetical protein
VGERSEDDQLTWFCVLEADAAGKPWFSVGDISLGAPRAQFVVVERE